MSRPLTSPLKTNNLVGGFNRGVDLNNLYESWKKNSGMVRNDLVGG